MSAAAPIMSHPAVSARLTASTPSDATTAATTRDCPNPARADRPGLRAAVGGAGH